MIYTLVVRQIKTKCKILYSRDYSYPKPTHIYTSCTPIFCIYTYCVYIGSRRLKSVQGCLSLYVCACVARDTPFETARCHCNEFVTHIRKCGRFDIYRVCVWRDRCHVLIQEYIDANNICICIFNKYLKCLPAQQQHKPSHPYIVQDRRKIV